MTMPALFRRLLPATLLGRFAKDRNGVALVEFSFIAPILICAFFGTLEVSQAYSAQRKAAIAARALGDLVSRVDTVSDADLNNVFNAAIRIIEPFDTVNSQMRVTSIVMDSNAVAKVDWSKGRNMTAAISGAAASPPTALTVKDTSVIRSEVCVSYSSIIGYFIKGQQCYAGDGWFRPRISARVTKV